MPSGAFGVLRGRLIRVTRVNSLGRPVYGPNAWAISKGFIRIAEQQQITEGEQISLQNASGENCVSDKSPDSLDWINLTIDFCQVDFCMFTLMNEHFKQLRNCYGEVHGLAESYNLAQDSGFAIEIWQDTQGWVPTDQLAEGAWLYKLLSFCVGARLGDETTENNATTFQVVARTKRGSGWDVGPHNDIECQDPVTGQLGPLLTPVTEDEPRRRQVVTSLPALVPGCQPLSPIGAPVITVTEAAGDPDRRTVRVTPPTTGGPWTINWGDGSIDAVLPGAGATHQYPAPVATGVRTDYVLSVWANATPLLKRYEKVTVPFTGTAPVDAPVMDITEDTADPDGMSVDVLVDNHGNGAVTINWGDATATSSNPGDNTTVSTHAYANEGTYTITATDSSDATLTSMRQVAVPYDGGNALTATVVESTPQGPDRRTVTATWDNQGQGAVTIDWGDGTAPESGVVAGTANHAYANAGTYQVVIRDTSNASRSITVPVTVPFV